MNANSRINWLILIAATVLVVVWVFFRFVQKIETAPIFFEAFIWMMIGALARLLPMDTPNIEGLLPAKSAGPSPGKEKRNNMIWGLVLGWAVLWVLWKFPDWFQNINLSDHGFEIDLQGAPVVFWAGFSFLPGYYPHVIWKIPKAAWNQFSKTWGIKEAMDLKGNAKHRLQSYWNGLKGLIGLE